MIKENATAIIKDLGLYYENLFDKVPPAVKKEVWRGISNFVLSLVEGIEEQNDVSSGYTVPPVLPHELVKLCNEFNAIVTKQTRRF